tara:strand:+ start:877 stop:1296 length:420 start_codon:yes stop_codon:yes gene_type:complete
MEITNPPKQIRVLYKPEINIHLVENAEYQYSLPTTDLENDTFYTKESDAQKIIDKKVEDADDFFLFEVENLDPNEHYVEVSEDRSGVYSFKVSDLDDNEVQSFLQDNDKYELIKTDNDCFFQLKEEFMKLSYPNETSIN